MFRKYFIMLNCLTRKRKSKASAFSAALALHSNNHGLDKTETIRIKNNLYELKMSHEGQRLDQEAMQFVKKLILYASLLIPQIG